MSSRFLRNATIGFIITSIFFVLLLVIELILNILTIAPNKFEKFPLSNFFLRLLLSITLNFWVAFLEELIYRGFLLFTLSKSWGITKGFLGMAILFILPHFLLQAAPSYWFQYSILLIISSFIFAICFLKTNSCALSFGVHFSFNFVSQDLLNLSTDATTSVFNYQTSINPSQIPIISFFMQYNFFGLYCCLICSLLVFFFLFQKKLSFYLKIHVIIDFFKNYFSILASNLILVLNASFFS